MSESIGGASGRKHHQEFVDTSAHPGKTNALPKETDGDLDATFAPETTVPDKPRGAHRMQNPSTAKPSEKPPGRVIGKYQLLKKLGQGGMGEVYLGEDIKLGRKAAIKLLSKQLADKEDFVTRFHKEARAMARVIHDNAVSVFDVDEDHGVHYVAMEYIDGQSMQKWMDALGRLSVGDALHVTLRCAEALNFAHGQNLIHRDIKPDNIMVTSRGKVKVADFGLAKATDEDLSMTASGTGLGTPYYMAPEQARNAKHVDARADVYALGVTLYYFLTGKLPFSGNSALDIVVAKEKGRFESARKLNSQVPDRLDLMIAKMLEKDPAHRCRDCNEVIELLSGLGLENPSLSFIEAADRVVHKSASSPPSRTASRSAAAPARSAATPARRSSAEPAPAKAPAPEPAIDGWIVQYKTPQGKDTIGKFTTVQILSALKTGAIDVKAKVKRKVNEPFAPIGFFPEFERAVEGRNIRDKAEQKSTGLKSEFERIGRQYDRRGWTRWFRNLISGTAGLVSLLVWLAIVSGVIVFLIVYFPTIWDTVANTINSRTAQPPSPPQP